MSSYSSRPNVSAVDSAMVDVAIAGTVLIGALLFNCVKALAKASCATALKDPGVLMPSVAVKSQAALGASIRIQGAFSKFERNRFESLMQLAQQPLRVSETATIMPQVKDVLGCTTSAQLSLSIRKLRKMVVAQNDSLFAAGVARSCQVAMAKIGFERTEVSTNCAGVLRVVGTDQAGRALVSELTVQPGRQPILETETVNVLDGTCTEILDRFDRAVEEVGLRSSDPKRRLTGGICQTAAGKALIRTKFAQQFRRPVGQATGSSGTGGVAQPRIIAVSRGRQ